MAHRAGSLNQMIEESKSGYVKKCAACGAEFNPVDSPAFKRHFPCAHLRVCYLYRTRKTHNDIVAFIHYY